MWELDYKESWAPKNWCFWTVVLDKTLESPLDCKEIQPVHPKRGQSWVFFGRTDFEAETPILRPPDEKSWLICKDPDAEKDWGQEEKGTTEDETVGWHHQLNGHGFWWTPRVGDGWGGLRCCSSWGRKESVMTEWLNWTELNLKDTTRMLYNRKVYNCLKKRWCKMFLDLTWRQKFIWNHQFPKSTSMSLENVWLYQAFKKHRLIWKSILSNSPDDRDNQRPGWHKVKKKFSYLK